MMVSFDRKIGIFSALAALAGTAAIGSLAYFTAERTLTQYVRNQVQNAATQLATQAADELKGIADRARFYVSTAQPRAFEADGDILALTVLKNIEDRDWQVSLRWTLPETDPSRLTSADFAEVDLKHPLDFARIAQGQNDVIYARSARASGFLRLAVPYGPKLGEIYAQALVIELKLNRFQSLFKHRESYFAFMTTARGRLLIASDGGHLSAQEDLSPIVARSAGAHDYRESPRGEIHHAFFRRVGPPAGWMIVAQAPHSAVFTALEPLVYALIAAGLVFATLWYFAMTWLSRNLAWERHLGLASAPTEPRLDLTELLASTDREVEIEDLVVQAPVAQSRVEVGGQRIPCAILHAQLGGFDALVAQAEPTRLLALLKQFRAQVTETVQASHGVIDYWRGSSVVALWGLPLPDDHDAARAIQAVQALREAAQTFNKALEAENHLPCRLGMGLHYDTLIVDSIGVGDRLEYTALGAPLEIAARIQAFTGQLGTDFLMTGAAAAQLGTQIAVEQVTVGDDQTPELFELATEAVAEVRDTAA